jgi:hypothetical protein
MIELNPLDMKLKMYEALFKNYDPKTLTADDYINRVPEIYDLFACLKKLTEQNRIYKEALEEIERGYGRILHRGTGEFPREVMRTIAIEALKAASEVK